MNYLDYANGGLQNETQEILDEFYEIISPTTKDALSSGRNLGVGMLLEEVLRIIGGESSKLLSFFLLAFGAALIVAIAGAYDGKLKKVTECGAMAVLSFAIFLYLYPLVAEVANTSEKLSSFFSALLPIMTAHLALGGGVGTAAVTSYGMQLALFLMGILSSLLGFVVLAMFGTSVISSLPDSGVSRVARGIKKSFTKVMGVLVAFFAGMLALQTYISASGDSGAIRMAKYAAQDMIPIVGGAVSGALSTLAGGLSYVGGVLGAGAVFEIVILALSPIVILLLYKLALSLSVMLLDFCGATSPMSCISGFKDALDGAISVLSMTIIVYIIEVVIAVMGGAQIWAR